MEETIIIQQVDKNTFKKIFIILSLPITACYLLSLLMGHRGAVINFIIVIILLNLIVLGALKISFPKKEMIKIKNKKYFVYSKKNWVNFDPVNDLFFKHHYILVRVNKKLITVHLKEQDIQKLKELLKNQIV